jgi:hypothetical protein
MNQAEHNAQCAPAKQAGVADKKDDSLDSIKVVELAGKLGAGFIGFSFVSGYLIVNTYLSSFGIRGDAGDLLKAKYIYVGFLYVLFMSVIVLPFAAMKQGMDLWGKKSVEATSAGKAGVKQAEDHQRKQEEEEHQRITAYSFLIWVLVVMAFEIPISLQLTLLQPKNVKDFLLIQLVLLCAVFVYQLTYYRSYNDYEWDKLSTIVYHRRWWCFGIEAGIGLVIIVSLFARQMLRSVAESYKGHLAWQIAIPIVVPAFLTWVLKPLFLSISETRALDAGRTNTWSWLGKKSPVIFFFSVLGLSVLINPTFVPYWIRWFLIQTGTLIMAITVLCGVVVLSILANKRREKEVESRRAPGLVEHEQTGRWIRWILRVSSVVTLYVISTLGYAYVIYSHIPVQKEGGDYTTSPVVRVSLKPPGDLPKKQSGDPLSGVQKELAGGQNSLAETGSLRDAASEKSTCLDSPDGLCVVILEQTSSFLYVARLSDWDNKIQKDQCGPRHWRDGILEEGGPYRPHVISIPLADIRAIEQTGFVDAKSCL